MIHVFKTKDSKNTVQTQNSLPMKNPPLDPDQSSTTQKGWISRYGNGYSKNKKIMPEIPSLKLTAKAPENRLLEKEIPMSFTSGFRGELAVSFGECSLLDHLGCITPCQQWDRLPTSTGAGFQPINSSISILFNSRLSAFFL